MSSDTWPTPKRVLIIGGGPTGLVALRNMKERGGFDHVELYERRDNIGGVWYFDERDSASTRPRWPSPAYRGLIGNVLPEFLGFSEFPFPKPPSSPLQPFPTLKETHEYLLNFAEPNLRSGTIKLNSEVISVVELEDGKGWSVISRDWSLDDGRTESTVEEVWDAVVVAVGWFDHPVWPDTAGLDELRARGLAKHAKWWRGPEQYIGKKVLVVGNANSGNDIAAQLAPIASQPVYQSVRRKAILRFPCLVDDRIQMVAPVAKYIVKTTSVSGDDGSGREQFDAVLQDGTTVSDLDVVHLATGYRPFINFVRVLDHNATVEPGSSWPHTPLVSEHTQSPRVPSLHKLIMYAYNPSLGFVGAHIPYTPFTMADVASTWLALAWRGEIPFPTTSAARLVFEQERLAAIERSRREADNPSSLKVYSVLGADEQEYARGLRMDIVRARPGLGAVLADWNDERTKLREGMYVEKLKALEYARDRINARPVQVS